MATITVTREVRDALRDAATAAHLTQGQLIETLLTEHRKVQFWTTLEAETPDQAYLEGLAETDSALLSEADFAISRLESASSTGPTRS